MKFFRFLNSSKDLSRDEDLWLLRAFLAFTFLRWVSLNLHFFGLSPYGGPLAMTPFRFLYSSLAVETGVILALVLAYRLISLGLGLHGKWLRIPFVILASIYLIFTQIDLEFVRWLGEHLTLSFVGNYFRKTDGHMLGNVVSKDIPSTATALGLIFLNIPASIVLVRMSWKGRSSFKAWIWFTVLAAALCTSPMWFRPSDKRWRRICPVVVSLSSDLGRTLLGMEKPKNPMQAYSDLIHYVKTGRLADTLLRSIPEYPFYNPSGPGNLSPEEFKKLPRDKRPNIIFLTFETWRGWKTGMVQDSTPGYESRTPTLDSILEASSYYFPYVHSLGFPSVEGTYNLHLGSWPHFRKIVISSYGNMKWKSLPEIFHDLGYTTQNFIGADPSFSNLVPWFTRWYEYTEYSEKYTQDGPLLERFTQALDTINREKPFFLHTWTVTTHPQYIIPDSEGIPIADDIEDRYDQSIRYAEKQIVKLIRHLQKSDLWANSILVIVGDHSQPETTARNNTDIAGAFTPGHTWVHAAILGGWPGLPKPRRNEETIPSIDVPYTVLELVNASVPNHFMGKSMLRPASREFLGFRWNAISVHHEEDRLLFDMFRKSQSWYKLDKSSKLNYALNAGHTMPKAAKPPYEFDKQRYRDMIFAFGELLEQDRMFPEDNKRRGIYELR